MLATCFKSIVNFKQTQRLKRECKAKNTINEFNKSVVRKTLKALVTSIVRFKDVFTAVFARLKAGDIAHDGCFLIPDLHKTKRDQYELHLYSQGTCSFYFTICFTSLEMPWYNFVMVSIVGANSFDQNTVFPWIKCLLLVPKKLLRSRLPTSTDSSNFRTPS